MVKANLFKKQIKEKYDNNSNKTPSNPLIQSVKERSKKVLVLLQNLGKTLQFPIAVLPFAAILNRFGALGLAYTMSADHQITNQIGYWVSTIIQTPGGIVFTNLPIFFALGCGFGLTKDKRGEAALAAAAFYFVTVALNAEGFLPKLIWQGLPHSNNQLFFYNYSNNTYYSWLFYIPQLDTSGDVIGAQYILNIGVIGGIIAGCMTAFIYNRCKSIQLPKSLAFFGGRRFIPMLSILCAIPFSFMYAIIWPWIQFGLTDFGRNIQGTGTGAISGAFFYGMINRLTQPFGMHQILNVFLWFQLPIAGPIIAPGTGEVINSTVTSVNGDINAFTQGVFNSGTFQTGFFPMFLGGLPAITVAMIMTAKKENRKEVATFFSGVAFVTFLTGIDEPVVFSFVFISPLLLFIHAFYTGLLCTIPIAMHIHLGFGFSAGFIDYVISIPQSWGFSKYEGVVNGNTFGVLSNPLWIIPLALAAFPLYFFTFKFIIIKTNVKTPGREDDYKSPINKAKAAIKTKTSKKGKIDYNKKAADIILAINGGNNANNNIVNVDNCATRLRIEVVDSALVDEEKLKEAGTFGSRIINKTNIQIIIGVDVEFVNDAMQELLNNDE